MNIISFFSFFVGKDKTAKYLFHTVYEINEGNERTAGQLMQVNSFNSCNSFFSYFVRVQSIVQDALQNHAILSLFYSGFVSSASGVKSEGQHTRCTHRVLPRLAGGAAPSTPGKDQRQVTP